MPPPVLSSVRLPPAVNAADPSLSARRSLPPPVLSTADPSLNTRRSLQKYSSPAAKSESVPAGQQPVRAVSVSTPPQPKRETSIPQATLIRNAHPRVPKRSPSRSEEPMTLGSPRVTARSPSRSPMTLCSPGTMPEERAAGQLSLTGLAFASGLGTAQPALLRSPQMNASLEERMKLMEEHLERLESSLHEKVEKAMRSSLEWHSASSDARMERFEIKIAEDMHSSVASVMRANAAACHDMENACLQEVEYTRKKLAEEFATFMVEINRTSSDTREGLSHALAVSPFAFSDKPDDSEAALNRIMERAKANEFAPSEEPLMLENIFFGTAASNALGSRTSLGCAGELDGMLDPARMEGDTIESTESRGVDCVQRLERTEESEQLERIAVMGRRAKTQRERLEAIQ